MARSRATEAFQKRELAGKGKRSNVVLQSQDVLERDEDGFEDEGVLFDAVQRGKENARQAKKPRFSLADSLNDSMSVASADVRNLRKRVASRTPSAFSPVSTAPPSDTRAPEDVEVTRTAQDRESTEGYIPPAAQASQPDYHDYDDAMPMPDDDDDDEMIPDEPPQSPSQEYGESQELQTQTEADFPVGMDDDDDDNDGPGFVAASDPAPSSPEEEPQEPVPAKKAKKTKKKVQIESSDESSVVRAPKPRKKQQKRVVFSPKGIQSGPREYEAVPVSDLKASPPQDKKLRRSGRARVSPLEYWRGETCEYGPNDFGDDYVGVKNMPVVKAVVRAKPTPYKPRKERPPMAKKKKSNSKQVDQDTHIIADIPEFDSMKLRRRYDVIDGDHAVMWDDAMGEGVESSTLVNTTTGWFDHSCLTLARQRWLHTRRTLTNRSATSPSLPVDRKPTARVSCTQRKRSMCRRMRIHRWLGTSWAT